MVLEQLISQQTLRKDFRAVEEKIARYGEVYILQNDQVKYVMRGVGAGEAEPTDRGGARAERSGPAAEDRRLSREEHARMVRKLNSIGKGIFVTYYDHFKAMEDPLVFLAGEDFTDQSKRGRSSTARYIFRQGWQHHALRYILEKNRAAPPVIQQARRILERETAQSGIRQVQGEGAARTGP